jgi:indolepyruvate ferredoxin oxidoreductase beta subunit
MKIVILGAGGMGAISLSKIIAQAAMNKNLSVKSTEIHGMAKKGGLVEIYMKIDEGASPYISKKDADFVILLDDSYFEYGSSFLMKTDNMVVLNYKKRQLITSEFGDIRLANSFMLGEFAKRQPSFTKYEIINVLKHFKRPDDNIRAFERGYL